MKRSPIKAIREKCLDCCGNQKNDVRACSSLDCPIWEFRLGINYNCGNNDKNPFLDKDNFKGLAHLQADEIIETIKHKIKCNL